MNDHLLEMIENKAAGLYNYKTDLFLEKNLLGSDPGLELKMEEKLKAIIQTYNSRLLDNDMTVGSPKTEDGRPKTEDGRPKTEDGRRKAEDGRPKTEVVRRKSPEP
jgi:hypothetical protein